MAFEHIISYATLFFGCFLSATVVPFSSEAILSGMLLQSFNATACLIIASIGNWAGGMTGYILGYNGKEEWLQKYLRVKVERIQKWKQFLNKWKSVVALLCWLPFIGDFLAVGLGYFKISKIKVAILMFIGKLIRYAFVIFALDLIF